MESLTELWVNVHSVETNRSELCGQATKVILLFPTTYLCQAGLFRKTCETNSGTRFSLQFVNVGDKPNLLKLVFVFFS